MLLAPPQAPDHLTCWVTPILLSLQTPLISSSELVIPPVSFSLDSEDPVLFLHPPCSLSAPTQVGLLSYSHRPSPLFPLNSSHDLGIILQKIRDIPYVDPSGNNLGKGCKWRGLLGLPHQEFNVSGF